MSGPGGLTLLALLAATFLCSTALAGGREPGTPFVCRFEDLPAGVAVTRVGHACPHRQLSFSYARVRPGVSFCDVRQDLTDRLPHLSLLTHRQFDTAHCGQGVPAYTVARFQPGRVNLACRKPDPESVFRVVRNTTSARPCGADTVRLVLAPPGPTPIFVPYRVIQPGDVLPPDEDPRLRAPPVP